ncbi:hypothetical protein LTR49_026501 [Elasticomyces elasticus]|nr:hypothetical protein LTR49_026501 [Elasticomyces elasticus]
MDLGLTKIQEYYDWSDYSRLSRAAIALHPGKRFTWFEKQWLKEKGSRREVANAKKATKNLWQQHLHNLPSLQQLPQKQRFQPPPKPKNRARDDDSDDEIYTAAFGSYTTPLVAVK